MVLDYDVVVCGGGPAGIIASYSAASCGKRTLLVEKCAFLGGLASGGLVAPISEFKKNGHFIVKGFPWKFIELLESMGGADTSYPNGNIPFDSEIYKLAADRFLMDVGVDVLLNTTISDCSRKGRKIVSITCVNNSGQHEVSGREFIDCTGDAVLCSMAEVPFLPSDSVQAASLCFKIANVDISKLENTKLMEHGKKYANSRIKAKLESLRDKGIDVPFFGGPWFQQDLHQNVVYCNMTRAAVDISDPMVCSKVEQCLREDAFRLFALLKENENAFRDSYISQTAIHAGYRESRRIRGNHILTGTELIQRTHFDDTIACSGHPVDIHIVQSMRQDVTFLAGEGYIPFRSLYTDYLDNLLVAGRCISADRDAFASVRVQAPCMAMGQAAGTAAALCIQDSCSVSELDSKKLVDILIMQDACL